MNITPTILSAVTALSTLINTGVTTNTDTIQSPVEPPEMIRKKFELSSFYKQWIDVKGFPVVASEKANPQAIQEAAWLIQHMIGHRPDILNALANNNVRFSVMAYNEMTTDIPEHSDLHPDFYWDRRARGLGATASRPSTSCGEENLLNYNGDPYLTENILIHEFSHAIHQMGLSSVDPEFDSRLKSLYEAAIEKGLWKGTYASTNKEEYWAEGTQSWFDTNRENDSQHNHVSKRHILKDYDPGLAALLTEIFGDTEWRYTQAITRTHLPHLKEHNPDESPKFEWPADLAAEYDKLFDPNMDGREKWIDLKRHEPDDLSQLKSKDGDGTSILFVNTTNSEISYYWVDADGNENYRGRVAANAFSVQWSHAGHIWLVKDSTDNNIGVFQGGKKTGRALIGK